MEDIEMFQQAIQPLIRSIDKMEAQVARIAERIDAFPNLYISRQEHDARREDLITQMNNLNRSYEQYRQDFEQYKQDIANKKNNNLGHFITILLAMGGWFVAITGFVLSHYWH